MTTKTFVTTIYRDDPACLILVPFDPRPVFGKVRAPVRVTVNGFTFRSTIAAMGGRVGVPFRRSNREAAGLEGGETVEVTLALDTDERRVTPPADLVAALQAGDVFARWQATSTSRRREDVEAVEGAKAPATRQRRIARVVAAIAGRPAG